MNTIREQSRNPFLVGIAGFVVGMLFGLIVLGWWLWPVQWENATPAELGPTWQEQYLRMSIAQYGVDGDPAAAQARYQALGEAGEDTLLRIAQNPQELSSEMISAFTTVVTGAPVTAPLATPGAGAAVTPGTVEPGALLTPGAGAGIATQPAEPPAEDGGGSRIVTVLIVLICVVLLAIAAAIGYVLLRGRFPRTAGGPMTPAQSAMQASRQMGMTDYTTGETEPPVAQFQASYMIGDDLFDDSFSIDSQTGEFLGECGVGISETIGVGDAKKVTAFEVWLFDKNDIQTVTKVLMSDHAFMDSAIRARLEAKGEPIQADQGAEFVLETQTLQMVATVKDMGYGEGAMPPKSYFEHLIIELAVWQKQPL